MNKLSSETLQQLRVIRNDWASCDKKFGDGTKKEYRCTLEGLDILLVFSEHLHRNHVDPLIPSRINISSKDSKIEEIFHTFLMQPTHKNWNKDLWVFRNNSYVNYKSFQYQLRFFPNEEILKEQLQKEEEEYQLIQEFTVVEKEKSYFSEFMDTCFDIFNQLGRK